MSWENAASRSGVIIARVLAWTATGLGVNLCEVALCLECFDPFFQLSVKIDAAILDRTIEPVELFVGGSEFGL